MAIIINGNHQGFLNRENTALYLDCSVETVDNLRRAGYLLPVGKKGFYRYGVSQIDSGMRRMTRDHRRFKVIKELTQDKKEVINVQ